MRKIFHMIADFLVRVLGAQRANRLTCNLWPKLSPIYQLESGGVKYRFHCPNGTTLWRAKTLLTKEPETIDWISTFAPGEVFFDIGANVGLYTIYAAKRGVEVLAFEPEAQNYALLNRNVHLNGLGNTATCLNLALSDRPGLDYLYLSELKPGESLHNFGECVDWHHKQFQPSYRQGVLAHSIDSFLSAFPERFPAHIKIDVDGAELKIIKGAENTLNDPRLKSLLIEINEELAADLEIAETLLRAGFKMSRRAQAQMFNGGEYGKLYNCIFLRESFPRVARTAPQ